MKPPLDKSGGSEEAGNKREEKSPQKRAKRLGRAEPVAGTGCIRVKRSGDCEVTRVTVRNLEVEVVAALKRQAKQKGRSLEQELRNILRNAAHLSCTELGDEAYRKRTRAELLAEADRIRAMSGPQEDSVLILRRIRGTADEYQD